MVKKTEHGKHGENKTAEIYARLTPTGKQGLREMAQALGLSMGEFLDQIGQKQILLQEPLASSSLPGEF